MSYLISGTSGPPEADVAGTPVLTGGAPLPAGVTTTPGGWSSVLPVGGTARVLAGSRGATAVGVVAGGAAGAPPAVQDSVTVTVTSSLCQYE